MTPASRITLRNSACAALAASRFTGRSYSDALGCRPPIIRLVPSGSQTMTTSAGSFSCSCLAAPSGGILRWWCCCWSRAAAVAAAAAAEAAAAAAAAEEAARGGFAAAAGAAAGADSASDSSARPGGARWTDGGAAGSLVENGIGDELLLANWCSVQRIARRSGVLSADRIAQLEAIGFDFDGADALS